MKKLLIIIGVIFLTSCATRPKMSPMQKRAMQSRTFNSSYDNVFKAFRSVLQDEGYIIKNQDYEGGLILAEKGRKTGSFISVFGDPKEERHIGVNYNMSVNFDKINASTIETRVTMQEEDQYSRGSRVSDSINNPDEYKNLYNKVSLEIKRREARQ